MCSHDVALHQQERGNVFKSDPADLSKNDNCFPKPPQYVLRNEQKSEETPPRRACNPMSVAIFMCVSMTHALARALQSQQNSDLKARTRGSLMAAAVSLCMRAKSISLS